MRTSKPFSTISYNSSDFLRVKLDDLVKRRKIAFFAWVLHHPEEDEKKEHKHLFIVPNGQIDTDQVLDYLLELDPSMPDKPLGCIRPHSSRFSDWYLYALHDTSYLASKGQSRKYHYCLEDFITSDSDYFLEEIHTIDFSKIKRFDALKSAAINGVPFSQLVLSGVIPVQQFIAYREAYALMSCCSTERNGHNGHEIDPETGELK